MVSARLFFDRRALIIFVSIVLTLKIYVGHIVLCPDAMAPVFGLEPCLKIEAVRIIYRTLRRCQC